MPPIVPTPTNHVAPPRLNVLVRGLAVLFASLLGGCSSVSVQSKQYLGVPTFPPTVPASVEVLNAPPARSFVKIGEIAAEPFGDPTVPQIQAQLQASAAQMGGNAVVIVADRTMRMGATVTGPLWARSVDPNFERVIIGIVVHYTQ